LPIDRLKLDHILMLRAKEDSAIPVLVDVMIAMGRTLQSGSLHFRATKAGYSG
jgi:hypothetical protein